MTGRPAQEAWRPAVRGAPLDDPGACTFKLAAIPPCPEDKAGADCLTKAQRAAVAVIYGPGLGRPTQYVDGQIAAIAFANHLVLVTMNVRDFARFKGVEVENWSKRRG